MNMQNMPPLLAGPGPRPSGGNKGPVQKKKNEDIINFEQFLSMNMSENNA